MVLPEKDYRGNSGTQFLGLERTAALHDRMSLHHWEESMDSCLMNHCSPKDHSYIIMWWKSKTTISAF